MACMQVLYRVSLNRQRKKWSLCLSICNICRDYYWRIFNLYIENGKIHNNKIRANINKLHLNVTQTMFILLKLLTWCNVITVDICLDDIDDPIFVSRVYLIYHQYHIILLSPTYNNITTNHFLIILSWMQWRISTGGVFGCNLFGQVDAIYLFIK